MKKFFCVLMLCSMILFVSTEVFARSRGEKIVGTVLGTLINEAAKNSQRDNGQTTGRTNTTSTVESRQIYDELVKICKSGSLEKFKSKCKSWNLSPTSEISFKVQEEDAESGEMITFIQRYDLLFIAASSSPNAKIVKYLLDNGADANKANTSEYHDSGFTPLMIVASQNPVPEIAKVLIEYGADVNAGDSLSMAVSSSNVSENPSRLEIVKMLLNAGADVNAGNGAALIRAAGLRGDMRRIVGGDKNFDNTDVVAALIKAGANVNAYNEHEIGRTPLGAAVVNNNNSEAALMLIKAGANIKAKSYNDSIIHYAAAYCTDARVMREIIRRGANINEKDHAGNTVLQLAVIRNSPEVINVLLDAGADAKVKDFMGRSIPDLARADSKLSGTQVLKRLEAASKTTTKTSGKKTIGKGKKRK